MSNSRPLYYFVNFSRFIVPPIILRAIAKVRLSAHITPEITQRVVYYNKLDGNTPLGEGAKRIKDIKFGSPTAFYLDLMYYARSFQSSQKIDYLFRDITHIPDTPALVKSRPIANNNQNSILFKLNKIRHFIFVNDKKKYSHKKDILVWRGNVLDNQISRQVFLEKHFGNTNFNVGHVNDYKENKWKVGRMSIEEQLDYKFILSIEGNDVATNLKWIMSSNSLCFMCKPCYETWFMEGSLKPDFHYVEINDDYSDLEEKIAYYIENPQKAEEIIKNANAFTKQFTNKKNEHLISLLVLNKYLKLTN